MTGKTAFERLKAWWQNDQTPIELKYPNPLKAKIGNHILIKNRQEIGDDLWDIEAIAVMDRGDSGKLPVTDYALASEERRLLLRVLPHTPGGGSPILLMAPYFPEDGDSYPWGEESQPILDALMDPTGEFYRYRGEPAEECYYRDICNQHGTATLLQDADGDSRIDAKEVRTEPFSFWAFRRKTNDAAGTEFEQHLHAYFSGTYDPATKRVAGGDRTIAIHRGDEIPATHVVVYGS